MKITSQAKDTIDESLQFGTQVFPMSQASKQFQPGRWTKQRAKERGYSGSTKRQKKVNFATLVDICHLRNAELEPKLQKYNGRVVVRVDIVQDMDVIARAPDCDGQAADAITKISEV